MAIAGAGPETHGSFLQALFFSVQTSFTVGYGQLAPAGLAGNVIMLVPAIFSLDLQAKAMLSRFVDDGFGVEPRRVFHDLPLERSVVSFLHLSWTIVHPMDEERPLPGLKPEDCARSRVEAVVLLRGRVAHHGRTAHPRVPAGAAPRRLRSNLGLHPCLRCCCASCAARLPWSFPP